MMFLILIIPIIGCSLAMLGCSIWLRYQEELNYYEEQRRAQPIINSIEELEQKKSLLKEEVLYLEKAQKALEVEQIKYESLKEEKRILEKAIKEQDIQKKTLEQDCLNLEKKVFSLEEARNHYDQLVSTLNQLKKKKPQLETDISNLKEEQKRLEEEVFSEGQKRKELNELEHKLQNIRIEYSKLTQEIGTLKAQKNRLDSEIEACNDKLSGSRENVKLALESLHNPYFNNSLMTKAIKLKETDFINQLDSYIRQKGYLFHPRLLRAFHTSLKCQDISSLVVLAGISGTGKSLLPQMYAEYANIDFIIVPVQPRWDSPQDLLGFYNYMEHRYKPTDLVRALYQFNTDKKYNKRMMMVLLDEMNLARVEYYFSDFLSKLESRRSNKEQAFVELEFGSLNVSTSEKELPLSERVLFIGTMNEDESTQTLSDKVLDRATVITFPRPSELIFAPKQDQSTKTNEYLTFELFEAWSQPKNIEDQEGLENLLNTANEILSEVDRSFAHRVAQGIVKYVRIYPGVDSKDTDIKEARRQEAIGDQFAQKIITKLKGLPLDETVLQVLTRFDNEVIAKIGDPLLQAAFKEAYEHTGYSFNWKGLSYETQEQNS